MDGPLNVKLISVIRRRCINLYIQMSDTFTARNWSLDAWSSFKLAERLRAVST